MIARSLILSLAWLALAPAAANAAEGDEILGQFRDWYAVAYQEQGRRICYMVSRPTGSDGDDGQRGPVYIQITRRAGEPEPDVVSFAAGYPFRSGSKLNVAIDGAGHELFTEGDAAWAYGPDEDKALVEAMAKGREMVVRGLSARGAATTDTYSLFGFMAAQRAMTQACGE